MKIRSILSRIHSIASDRRGNVLMLTALALPVVIGATGLGVHTLQLSLTKRQLQRQADSAALAGAHSLYQGLGNSAAVAAADRSLEQNGMQTSALPSLTPEPFTGSDGTSYHQTMLVSVAVPVPTPFMAIFGNSSSTVVAQARAAVVRDGNFCYLALEEAEATGVRFQGNTNLDLGCGVATNAKGASAVVAGGSAFVRASPIAAMGAVPPATNYAQGTVLLPNYTHVNDPFSDRDLNPESDDVSNNACKNGNSWKTINVPSGVTTTSAELIATTGVGGPGCYGTISVSGTLTLSPGTYYLGNGANNAGLQVNAQGKLICHGCTFVLTSTTPNNQNSFPNINVNASAELDLSPSTSGDYEGITMYRDSRAATSNQCCTINGNSSSKLSGAFYFPDDELTFNGTSGMILNCFQMVGKRLKFTGNSNILNSCTPPGGEEKWAFDKVRLIS